MAVHDFTRRTWGHDFTFTPISGGMFGKVVGWCEGIAAGDYLIFPNGERTTRYLVRSVSYFADPADMFKADVVFAPRKKNAPEGELTS